MIKLIGFGKAFGVIDPSPFVIKVDAFLRMTGLPYQYVADVNALRRAPKKKLPVIEDDGKVIADSYFIFEYLQDKYQLDIDKHLSAAQAAEAHLLGKSLDENFYWCLVYSRWLRDDTWPLIKNALFRGLPAPLKLFIPAMVRKSVRKGMFAHGIGRHSDAEMLQIFEHSLQSLSNLLGDKPYFFGDKVSSFDATAYGFLAAFIRVDIDNTFNRQAKSYSNLVKFCQRIHDQYYSEVGTPAATA